MVDGTCNEKLLQSPILLNFHIESSFLGVLKVNVYDNYIFFSHLVFFLTRFLKEHLELITNLQPCSLQGRYTLFIILLFSTGALIVK